MLLQCLLLLHPADKATDENPNRHPNNIGGESVSCLVRHARFPQQSRRASTLTCTLLDD